MSKPRFLVSNDDGVHATGLNVLAEHLAPLGEVWVVAPDRERSAVSHSISLHEPLRIREVGERRFAVSGTPTDSVYLALHHVLPGPPALVVSGINHGPNLGNDVLYSGTVSAAMEGALFGHSALAISLHLGDFQPGYDFEPAQFEAAGKVAAAMAERVLQHPTPPGVLLNVNVPDVPAAAIKGLKLCRLGFTDWTDQVVARQDPRGKPYFWIGGQRLGYDQITDSDTNAIAQGYVSVTPIHYDITDYRSFHYTRGLEVPGFSFAPDSLGDRPLEHPVMRRPRDP